MRHQRPLEVLLGSTRCAILAELADAGPRGMHHSALARACALPRSTLQRDLEALTEAGFLESMVEGRQRYYWLHPQGRFTKELRAMMRKHADWRGELTTLLAANGQLKFALLSEPKGGTPDLLLIGSLPPSASTYIKERMQESFGMTLNILVMPLESFTIKARIGERSLAGRLAHPSQVLVGSPQEFAQHLPEAKGLQVPKR